MPPTLAEVLELEPFRAGSPEVLTGSIGLDRQVRWVHVSELADIGGLLQGDELLLTTGVGLPEEDAPLRRYAADLADAGAVGVAVELGRRYRRVPDALVRAARSHRLALIALHREVRFVAITEAAHALILDEQLHHLHTADRAHRIFTRLTLEAAGPDQVVRDAAQLLGGPVVLEDLLHHALVVDGCGRPPAVFLDRWSARSRRVESTAGTSLAGPEGWLATPVGARGTVWGRLVAVLDRQVRPSDLMVLERAAAALAIQGLIEPTDPVPQAHHGLLADILNGTYLDAREIELRAEALGVPLAGRHLVGLVVHDVVDPDPDPSRIAQALDAALRRLDVTALVAPVAAHEVAALVPLADPTASKVLPGLTRALSRSPSKHTALAVAVGHVVVDLRQARSSVERARRLLDALGPDVRANAVVREDDLQLRHVLRLLVGEPTLQLFVERQLGPLVAHDEEHGTNLVATLACLFECAGNRSAAARMAGVSRATLYRRIETIEALLGQALTATGTSLHVALLAQESLEGPATRMMNVSATTV